MWITFPTLTDAQAYCDAATAALPHAPGDVTAVWDTPRELVDGRFVVAALTDGEPWGEGWTLKAPVDPTP